MTLSWRWNQNLIQLLNSLEQQPMNGHNNSSTVYYGTGHAETKEHLQEVYADKFAKYDKWRTASCSACKDYACLPWIFLRSNRILTDSLYSRSGIKYIWE